MIRRWGALLAFAATLACARTAHAGDDSWTPDDFEKPEPGAPSSRPEREPPEPVDPENVPRPQLEPRAAPFGARGQVVLFGGASLSGSYLTYSASDAESGRIELSPDFFYFPVAHLAVGLSASFGYSDGELYTPSDLTRTRRTSFFAGPRLGYDVPVSRYVSVFPIVGFDLGYVSIRQQVVKPAAGSPSPLTERSNTSADAEIYLELPLMFHPVQHFSFGIGPTFAHDFAKIQGVPDIGAQTTSFGGSIFVAGNWGGDLPPEEAEAAPPRKFESHLGTAGTVVLSSNLALGAAYKTYPTTDTSITSFTVGGDVQTFLGPRFSLGGGANFSVSSEDNYRGTSSISYSYSDVYFSAHASTGYAAPLEDRLWFYPRAYLGFAVDDYALDGGGQHGDNTAGIIYASAFAPVDFEVAPHFFVGIGPSIERDVLKIDRPGAPQNLGTVLGFATEIGTWL